MNSAAVFVLFACLLIVHVQGQAKTSVRRCLCLGRGLNNVRLQRIDKIEVYPPSAFCENMEILVVLKNGGVKKCMNPRSNFAKNYIRKATERRHQLQKNSTR